MNLVEADVDSGPAMMQATIKSVQEARSPSAESIPTVVGNSPTASFSGPIDREAMKARAWGSNAPATAASTTFGPDKTMQEDTAHLVGHIPTTMLATIESVQECSATQVGHTPTTKCSGSTALTGEGSPTTACACGYVFLNEERAVTTPTLVGDKRNEGWFLNTGAMNHMTVGLPG